MSHEINTSSRDSIRTDDGRGSDAGEQNGPDFRNQVGQQSSIARESSTAAAIAQGLICALGFYLVVPRLPVPTTFIQRYFCSHPLEYISTCLFFVGLCILFSKLRKLRRERSGVHYLHDLSVPDEGPVVDSLARFRHWLQERNGQLRNTVAARRVSDALQYVHFRQDNGLEEHLKYLAELATDRLHQSYALMRTISWAIPILGFLGTVIGITMAIANVTPEQLDSSLPEVTGGLAVAFDTTAQALGMSIVLVFGAFLVERGEQSVLNDVEQFGIDHLVNQLGRTLRVSSAPVAFDEELAQRTRRVLTQFERSWDEHLITMREGWTTTLAARTAQLSESLDRETQATLQQHRQSLVDSRDAYAVALRESTAQFTAHVQQTMAQFTDRVDSWQSALQATSLSAAGQSEELHRLGRTLLQLAEAEHKLAALQQQLNQNLQALDVVATLEQTVSSLNAAVHVMTAKTSLRAAA